MLLEQVQEMNVNGETFANGTPIVNGLSTGKRKPRSEQQHLQ
jgi:hypothetical protein